MKDAEALLTGGVQTDGSSVALPEIATLDNAKLLSGGQSLMPIGMEKTISVEQMADLINFLKNWRYLDGAVPLAE